MDNVVSVSKKHLQAIYFAARQFDHLLTINGASNYERLEFAKEFYEKNGIYVPQFEIKYLSVRDTLRGFLSSNMDLLPTPLKDLYPDYINWCKDNGLSPLTKQRFHAEIKELPNIHVKTSANYKGLMVRNLVEVIESA